METSLDQLINQLLQTLSMITNIIISIREHDRDYFHFMLFMSMKFNREYLLLLKRNKICTNWQRLKERLSLIIIVIFYNAIVIY